MTALQILKNLIPTNTRLLNDAGRLVLSPLAGES
jgi:hypothetical protein